MDEADVDVISKYHSMHVHGRQKIQITLSLAFLHVQRCIYRIKYVKQENFPAAFTLKACRLNLEFEDGKLI